MAKVLDGNLLTYIATGDHRGPVAAELVESWLQAGETLHAPALIFYEIASAFTQLIGSGNFAQTHLADAVKEILNLPITLHQLEDIPGVVAIALQLRRRSAYDAAYIALARDLAAELWTFDGPLARNSASLGFPVNLIEATRPATN